MSHWRICQHNFHIFIVISTFVIDDQIIKADLNASKKAQLSTRSQLSFDERLHHVSGYSIHGPGPTNQNLPEFSGHTNSLIGGF